MCTLAHVMLHACAFMCLPNFRYVYLCVCVHIYIYNIYIYTYMYYTYMYKYTPARTSASISAYLHPCAQMRTCTHHHHGQIRYDEALTEGCCSRCSPGCSRSLIIVATTFIVVAVVVAVVVSEVVVVAVAVISFLWETLLLSGMAARSLHAKMLQLQQRLVWFVAGIPRSSSVATTTFPGHDSFFA